MQRTTVNWLWGNFVKSHAHALISSNAHYYSNLYFLFQAYVKGVTEELATEIKTEIREVIAKVDNVLSESVENLDMNSLPYDKRYVSDFHKTNFISTLAESNSSPRCSLSNCNENMLYCPRQREAHVNERELGEFLEHQRVHFLKFCRTRSKSCWFRLQIGVRAPRSVWTPTRGDRLRRAVATQIMSGNKWRYIWPSWHPKWWPKWNPNCEKWWMPLTK